MDRWLRWLSRVLPRPLALHPAGHPHGEASVWRVESRGCVVAFLKVYGVADKWRRERTVLEHLAALPSPVRVPPLLESDADGLALLLGALPGRAAAGAPWSLAERRSLHEQAGRLRRALDALPVDEPDPMPLPEALRRRHRAWAEKARAHLEPALLDGIADALDPSALATLPRRWCHRDLSSSNWIVGPTDAGPRLGVIDFGQARPDAWIVDAVKLWSGPWHEEPSLADAFWTGYGRRPEPHELAALRQLVLLHGLATATWGDRHGHAGFSRHGRAVLHRALRRTTETAPRRP